MISLRCLVEISKILEARLEVLEAHSYISQRNMILLNYNAETESYSD